MSDKPNKIWDRLSEVLEVDNLDKMAETLHMNPNTLRGRKARGAIPYENIVQTLNWKQLVYVFKNEELSESGKGDGKNKNIDNRIVPARSQQPDLVEQLIGLLHRINDMAISNKTKIKFVDSLLNITETV